MRDCSKGASDRTYEYESLQALKYGASDRTYKYESRALKYGNGDYVSDSFGTLCSVQTGSYSYI